MVRGGANYVAIAPPNSYIDVANFTSPQHLVNFLKRLDKDDGAYNKFHAWRRDYVYVTDPLWHSSSWCGLCKALNDEEQKPKWYKDIHEFIDKSCATRVVRDKGTQMG